MTQTHRGVGSENTTDTSAMGQRVAMATQRNAVRRHHRTKDLGWPHRGHCVMCDLPSLWLLLGITPPLVRSYAVSVYPSLSFWADLFICSVWGWSKGPCACKGNTLLLSKATPQPSAAVRGSEANLVDEPKK